MALKEEDLVAIRGVIEQDAAAVRRSDRNAAAYLFHVPNRNVCSNASYAGGAVSALSGLTA